MICNLAILAHVDAGKTTLSERMLFMAGEVLHPGNVDEGLATLDYLPEEKAKGITIEAGITSFQWKGQTYNLVDTPGHIDFGVEVDLALEAVDGAVLVISGTSGVETQTISAWNKLKAKGIHPILFINKLDHPDSRLDEILMEIEERLDVRPILLSSPVSAQIHDGMLDVITRSRIDHDAIGKESIIHRMGSTNAKLERLRKDACEAAATADDVVMTKFLDEQDVSPEELMRGIKATIEKGEYVACYSGSAIQCRGVRQIMTAVGNMITPKPRNDATSLGMVFRIRHHRNTKEFVLFKSHTHLAQSKWPKGFQFSRIQGELLNPVSEIFENDIYALESEGKELALGACLDLHGSTREIAPSIAHLTDDGYQPLLHTRIECMREEDWDKIDKGLQLLKRSDPSIHIQRNAEVGGWTIKTVGEVQLDVILARLQREFQCEVRAGKPEVLMYEMLRSGIPSVGNTFHTPEHGILSIELSICKATASQQVQIDRQGVSIAESSLEALKDALDEFTDQGIQGKGPLKGVVVKILKWDVPSTCPIAWSRKVFLDALQLSLKPENIEVFEPHMEMEITVPHDYAGNLIGDLQARGGKVKEIGGDGKIVKIFLDIPLQRVFGYSTIGRSISKGTASYALRFSGHRSLQV